MGRDCVSVLNDPWGHYWCSESASASTSEQPSLANLKATVAAFKDLSQGEIDKLKCEMTKSATILNMVLFLQPNQFLSASRVWRIQCHPVAATILIEWQPKDGHDNLIGLLNH